MTSESANLEQARQYLKAIETLINKEIPWFDNGPVVETVGSAPDERPAHRGRSRAPTHAKVEPIAAAPALLQPAPRQHVPKPRHAASRPTKHRAEALADAPNDNGFNTSNMPAFLMRK